MLLEWLVQRYQPHQAEQDHTETCWLWSCHHWDTFQHLKHGGQSVTILNSDWSISYHAELWLVNQLPFGTLIGQSVSILNSDWSILPAVTKDFVSIDLSSLTAVTALWNDDSWAELVSSNNPAERATINSWNLLMTEITIESRELNFVKTFCSYMFSRSLQITSC